MNNIFSPKNYLEQTASRRRRNFKKSLFAICSLVFVVTVASGTAGYLNLFTTGLAEAAQRFENRNQQPSTVQALAIPDKRENTNESILPPTEPEEIMEDEEYYEDEEYCEDEDYDYIGENGCNVLGISVTGDIGTDYGDTTSNSVRDTLEELTTDERVKAILVDLDSGGGSPVAGDEIANYLKSKRYR